MSLNAVIYYWNNYVIVLGEDGRVYTPSELQFTILSQCHVDLYPPSYVVDAVQLWAKSKYADLDLEEFLDKAVGGKT